MHASFSPSRLLGRTGFRATRIGAGDLADAAVPFESCVSTLRRALDAGINLIDTAPMYEDGLSERIVGAAVRGRERSGLFVIDKVDDLAGPVTPQVEASLQRLGLSFADLFVFHAVPDLATWESLVRPTGAFAELDDLVRAGRTRFRGISSHHPDVLAAAIPSGLCDVVMFPIGPFVDPRYEQQILPLARRHGVGSVCFKAFGAGKLLGDTEGYQRPLSARPRGKLSSGGNEPSATAGAPVLPHLSVRECLDYTLTRDPDVALLGLSFPNEQDEAFAAVHAFAGPLPEPELAAIRRRAETAIAGKGAVWWNPKD